MARRPAMTEFLYEAGQALTRVQGPGRDVADQTIRRWATESDAGNPPQALPVCDWIAPALSLNATPLARAFGSLVPDLHWQRRQSARPEDAAFWNGHANAMILGPGGLESRSDLWIGATVMAPGVVYDIHTHPPAEIYLPLSPGEWWNADMPWTDPGVDGFIFNPPGIQHAMRAGTTPFLALWFLPI